MVDVLIGVVMIALFGLGYFVGHEIGRTDEQLDEIRRDYPLHIQQEERK